RTYFDIDAEQFADTVCECIKDGVTVIGGCCGTTPEYIAALRKRIDGMAPVKRAENTETVVSSSRKTVRFSNGPVLIGERINPTGKKRFKQALAEGDIDYITNEGLKQEEADAHILDVNVGTPEVDEVSMLTTVVTELQTVTDLPLQIDTANGLAMEKALRYYNGCPLINSVNGKAESMETVFPLVKKYGGVVVALTLDEKGIPATAEGRLEIAEKILKTAERYGVKRKNVVFDTLTMTVSTDKNAAKTTLDALKLIKEKTGCHTVLGVSNVSFGLPERSLINGSFFTMALYAGLSSAIMNPLSAEMMKSYRAYRALAGLDENFKEYTEYAAQNPAAESVTTSKSSKITTTSDLCDAVIKGMKEQAEKLTEELLADTAPLSIIEQKIMPALDVVGADYESGKIFLPQLLMAAEAAKAAFERIRQKAETTGQSGKGYFVLATVEGDIHDIGKNIVKLLLQNYGFDVIDLGKDVPAAVIVDKVLELHSKFAGLSALMTTTLPSMEKTVSLLHQKAPFCKVVVGGAVLTQEYADKIGADKYAKDAMETVRYALSVTGSKE
ncbi:MAG: dihydropteroate synthase, partial [Clostridia bacterium]|nr:dihydropteroate synthase [Clostridia bacterium]